MVRCASLFSQLLGLFNRQKFYELVLEHNAERYSKGYSSWDHFAAMLFCQLAQAKSLREICGGLACCIGKLRHLGMKGAPNKSTLSYANSHRPWKMYRDHCCPKPTTTPRSWTAYTDKDNLNLKPLILEA